MSGMNKKLDNQYDYDENSMYEDGFEVTNENDDYNSSASKKRKRDMFQLTIPVSPNFATSRRGKYEDELESTEERERKRIQQELESFKRERELAEERKLKALYGSEPYMPTRSIKPLTQPEEFQFATSNRPRSKREEDFEESPPSTKRRKLSQQNQSLKTEGGITIPEPFSFYVDERAKMKESIKQIHAEENGEYNNDDYENSSQTKKQKSPWMSLAAKIKQIENEVPDRWRRDPKPRDPSEFQPREITHPEEFVLHTQVRQITRPHHPPPVQEEPPKQFKALPLNKKIFESAGDLGVPRVEKRKPTQPISPHLAVDERAALKPSAEELREIERRELEEKRNFKAQPVNYNIPTHHGSGPIEQRPLTVPASPFLQTKERSIMKPQPEPKIPSPPKQFKARPMPIMDEPFVPKIESRSLTEPEPFNLESERLHIIAEMKKEKKLQKEKEELEQLRKFKARPVPQDEPFKPVFDIKITAPEPFNLESEERHEVAKEMFEEKIAKEEDEKRKARQFKAKPYVSKKQFLPQRSTKPLTEIDNFVLNSEERSVERREFENKKLQKEIAMQEAERKRKILEQEREKREIKLLRQRLVHKAAPIPDSLYKPPPQLKPSTQPLTEPKTPKFHANGGKKRRAHAGRDI